MTTSDDMPWRFDVMMTLWDDVLWLRGGEWGDGEEDEGDEGVEVRYQKQEPHT